MNYSTNITDSQWAIVRINFDNERKRQHDLRTVWNGIMYLLHTGCQWRMLPKEYGAWDAVYYYYKSWKQKEIIEVLHDHLVELVRLKAGKKERPTVGIIDSQSAKTTSVCGDERGFDAGKKIKGRKRHIMVDTLGLLIAVIVHSASIQDRDGAKILMKKIKENKKSLIKIFADGGYTGELINWVKQTMSSILEIVKRNETGFKILPKRWIVERTFAWISNDRRNSKDYERLVESSETMIRLSMIRVMLKKF